MGKKYLIRVGTLVHSLFLLSVGVFMLGLSGCTHMEKNYFCENYEVVESPPVSKRLVAELFLSGDSLLDVGRIFCINDKLIDVNTGNKDAVFTVYDSHGRLIGSFGKVGKARNEFTGGLVVTQQFEGERLWVNDVNKAMLARIDFKASLDSSTCVVDKDFVTAGRVINAFYVNDSTILYEQEAEDNYRLYMFNTLQDKAVGQYDLYIPYQNAFSVYYSNMLLHPDKSKLVAAMSTQNQVNFLSIKDGKKKAVSLYEESRLEKDNERQRQYYCDVTATADRIYALYMDQPKEESFDKPKPMEIHVFDWEGNFKERLLVNEYVFNIAVNEQGKYLYGLTLDNDVYRYEL